MTLDEAAAAMGWNGPKMSKVENAVTTIRPNEIGALLRVYGVTDPEVTGALENLARDAGKRGWWQTYRGVVSGAYADYISLESDAERIREWSGLLIPGLLQTAAYARETIAGITTFRSPEEVTALAEVRQARQAVLCDPDGPLEFCAVIHEAALHQRGTTRPTTMRDQRRRLLDAADMPNVTIQVMPLAGPAHPGVLGCFSLVSYGGAVPDIVLLENVTGQTYVEDDGTAAFSKAFELIQAAALPVEDSLALIKRMEEGSRE
jgi:hypothetical protein